MFQLWEVVSVIQDLPYRRQLEIIRMLGITSAVIDWNLFLLSDHDLVAYAKQHERIREGNLSLITRLSLLYICSMPCYGEYEKQIKDELTAYFSQIPLPSLFALLDKRRSPEPIMDIAKERGYEADYPETVLTFNSGYDYARAFEDNKVNIINAPFTVPMFARDISKYIFVIVELGKEEYFDRAVKRFLEVLASPDELGSRECLFELISFSSVHSENVDLAAKMMYETSPDSDLDMFLDVLKYKNASWTASFAKHSAERNYPWADYYDKMKPEHVQAIEEVLSNQV